MHRAGQGPETRRPRWTVTSHGTWKMRSRVTANHGTHRPGIDPRYQRPGESRTSRTHDRSASGPDSGGRTRGRIAVSVITTAELVHSYCRAATEDSRRRRKAI